MDDLRNKFSSSILSISTAKDKVLEISGIMLENQESSSSILTSLWLEEFIKQKETKKKTAFLYVMNDLLHRGVKEGNQYLSEFSNIFEDIIRHLVDIMSESLLEELRQIVCIWERPDKLIYIPEFISQIKESIQAGIYSVIDKKTGIELIQLFEVTQKLASAECLTESNLKQAEKIDSILLHQKKHSKWTNDEIRDILKSFQEKCEDELVERSNLLMDLSYMLQDQYEKYSKLN